MLLEEVQGLPVWGDVMAGFEAAEGCPGEWGALVSGVGGISR